MLIYVLLNELGCTENNSYGVMCKLSEFFFPRQAVQHLSYNEPNYTWEKILGRRCLGTIQILAHHSNCFFTASYLTRRKPVLSAIRRIIRFRIGKHNTDKRRIASAPVYCVPREMNPRCSLGKQNTHTIWLTHTQITHTHP